MPNFRTSRDQAYDEQREQHLQALAARVPLSYVADNFAKYASRQEFTRMLVRHELFKLISNVKGSIIECGVFSGNGLMTWAHLATIMEPVGFWRRIYGFDTFAGFPGVHANDLKTGRDTRQGEARDESYDDLVRCIELFDANRFLQQIPKVHLIKGDFLTTGQEFLRENPHVLVALLVLDFDLYEPTRKALELFLPRMCKGSVLVFDEINNQNWPGETQALLEMMDLRQVSIRKFPYDPHMAYVVL